MSGHGTQDAAIALASSVPATSSKGDGPVSVPVIPVTYFAQ